MPRFLTIFSNPSDTGRLRLDREHRRLDEVAHALGTGREVFDRRHAATLGDLRAALSSDSYEIVHFSSHGGPDELVLEDPASGKAEPIAASQISALLEELQPNLTAAIFASCYSNSALSQLVSAAPYVVTIDGPADDELAIGFVGVFYEEYIRSGSVGRAFRVAQLMNPRLSKTYNPYTPEIPQLRTVLTRRAEAGASEPLVASFPVLHDKDDPILIDVASAASDIASLGISRREFEATLSRKIIVHRWLFATPHDKTILQIGPFFGVFSWTNGHDLVVCHEIRRPRQQISEEEFKLLSGLLIRYNDRTAETYRSLADPGSPRNERHLSRAVGSFVGTLSNIEKDRDLLRKLVPDQAAYSLATIRANLEHAQSLLGSKSRARIVALLEAALTSLHDLATAMLDAICQPRAGAV